MTVIVTVQIGIVNMTIEIGDKDLP
jgi:hypothetical protein